MPVCAGEFNLFAEGEALSSFANTSIGQHPRFRVMRVRHHSPNCLVEEVAHGQTPNPNPNPNPNPDPNPNPAPDPNPDPDPNPNPNPNRCAGSGGALRTFALQP